jgi:ribonuclease P protein component
MENNSEKENSHYSSTFKKEERLCSKKQFDRLFAEGTSFLVYPLKVVFVKNENNTRFPVQAAFAVSKKIFKRAVKRNLLKRRMREAYRINKPEFYFQCGENKLALIFIYIGKEVVGYRQIETAVIKAMKKVIEKLSE